MYEIKIDLEKRRVSILGPLPLKDIGKVMEIAEATCGADSFCDSLVAQELGLSLAICAQGGCEEWRKELGIEVSHG